MRLILRDDVDGLGHRGDIVEVADGYGRNYLVPNGLAMRATSGAERQAESMARARAAQDAEERTAAEALAGRLAGTTVVIPAKAGPEGKLFGSVSTVDVVRALEAAGVEVDKASVELDEPVKEVGDVEVPLRLHAEVSVPVTVQVVAE